MAATAFTLTIALFSGDRAYHLAQRYGFDPSPPIQASTAPAPNVRQSPNDTEPTSLATHGRLQQAIDLFRRVPTLRALFLEVLSFQSLNTILQIALVRTLKTEIPDDVARSAYTGRLYAVVNACSALFQFGVFPFVLRRLEPRWIWRALPWGSWLLSLRLVGRATSLTGVATAVVVAKVTDYAVRSVVYPMAYQPLDYHSRYVGKEVIGVFGSRTGKSGVSLLLSSLTMLGCTGLPQLNQLALVAASLWMASTVWLSRLIPTQADAQARVEQRQQTQKAQQGGQPTTAGRIKLE
jgi:ATP/ADP translocase